MITSCINYNDCRRNVELCNEDRGISGFEVYPDSVPCEDFTND